MNYGKVEEPSSSRNRLPSTARFAATSAILTVTLSRSDRAPISSTVNTRPGWDTGVAHPPNPIQEPLKMTPQLSIAREGAGLWRVTFNNPPINMFVPATIDELGAFMTDLEADRSVKVVAFQSANPDFFVAHLDVAK